MNKFFKDYAIFIVMVLACIASAAIIVVYGNYKYKEGVDDIFRYCHDAGGILRNSETNERIGCGAVVQEAPQKEWSLLTNS